MLIHDEHARAVVPHEDKQVYPTAREVYGDAEVVVHEEDTQPITVPIVDPQVVSTFDAVEAQFPETSFDFDFMGGHMGLPEFTRLVSVVGHLHHGKTTLLDIFVNATHPGKSESLRAYPRRSPQPRGSYALPRHSQGRTRT